MAPLFGVIGGIVAVATLVAWLIRFRPADRDAAVPTRPEGAGTADRAPGTPAPLPPAAFVSAVEQAISQEVVFLRLRTPSSVFRLEAPVRGD